MKIKKLIKLLECIEGKDKLPQDMYELGVELHEQSNGKYISIKDMDFIHVMRAFIKQEKKISDEKEEKEFIYESGLEASVSQTNQIFKLEKRVSELLEDRETLNKRIKSFYESQIPSSVPTATFNYIPNNEEGEKLVDDMKQYLNKERYTLRDRGQCIDREKYSLDEVSTDRGIDKKEYGKFIKVHINEKRRK
tara:strand:- start:211 stop:789 length:579 start_codon:yes stop_codon:yes gene_type:complete